MWRPSHFSLIQGFTCFTKHMQNMPFKTGQNFHRRIKVGTFSFFLILTKHLADMALTDDILLGSCDQKCTRF